MIDYSVYMQSNYLRPEAGERAYAKAQVREVISLERFVQHIADHNGVFSPGTVKGVIADMCECIVELLLNGDKICLGELGNFSTSLSCESAENCQKFSSNNITAVNIVFTPSEKFENLRSRATFRIVSSRLAQAATLKAEKAGESLVDLQAAKQKPATGNGDEPADENLPTDNDDSTDAGDSGTGGNSGSGTGSDDPDYSGSQA